MDAVTLKVIAFPLELMKSMILAQLSNDLKINMAFKKLSFGEDLWVQPVLSNTAKWSKEAKSCNKNKKSWV